MKRKRTFHEFSQSEPTIVDSKRRPNLKKSGRRFSNRKEKDVAANAIDNDSTKFSVKNGAINGSKSMPSSVSVSSKTKLFRNFSPNLQTLQDGSLTSNDPDDTLYRAMPSDDDLHTDYSDDNLTTDSLDFSIPINPMEEAHLLLKDLVGNWNDFKQNFLGVEVKLFRNVMELEWFSLERFMALFKKQSVLYGSDLHVVKCVDGIRHNADTMSESVATYAEIMEFSREGCSLRLTQPHKFDADLAWRLQLLQEVFESAVGCNAYYTPKGMQGFAPHFDDVDAFVLQISGCKHWKVYMPKHKEEQFNRFSSPDYELLELNDYTVVFDDVLQTGDVLYMPRAYVHYAKSLDSSPSLHLTISAFQSTTYADVYLAAMQKAVCSEIDKHVSLRRNLPLGTFSNLMELDFVVPGLWQAKRRLPAVAESTDRCLDSMKIRHKHIYAMYSVLAKYQSKLELLEDDIVEAVGDLALQRVQHSMPLSLHPSELKFHMRESNTSIGLNTFIRLCRWSIVCVRRVGAADAYVDNVDADSNSSSDEEVLSTLDRLKTARDEKSDAINRFRVYSTVNNYWTAVEAPGYFTIDAKGLRVISFLYENYPTSVAVGKLPGEDDNAKIELVKEFFMQGIIIAVTEDAVSRAQSFVDTAVADSGGELSSGEDGAISKSNASSNGGSSDAVDTNDEDDADWMNGDANNDGWHDDASSHESSSDNCNEP